MAAEPETGVVEWAETDWSDFWSGGVYALTPGGLFYRPNPESPWIEVESAAETASPPESGS